jgi:pimeloyl-ACP methyl ester carboxylesterase/tetratricopeptide (TPR) repeat protein
MEGVMEKTFAPITLIIEGTPSKAGPAPLPPELRQIIGQPRLQEAYDLQPALRGAAVAEIPVQAKVDDLIELHLKGDLRLLMTVADYRAQFGDQASRGLPEAGVVRIGAALPGKSRERGLFQWVVKGLQLIGIDLTEKAAAKLAAYVDSKKGLEGLYACSLSSETFPLSPGSSPVPREGGGRQDGSAITPSADPLLVFIHGTMSSTEGSFGGLWSERRDVLQRLAQRYNGRCYAFEHKTFTESPITNALALATALPDGARLHLVSHSRGGMVGELLCRASRTDNLGVPQPAFDDTDFNLFSAANLQVTRGELLQLADLLKKKQLNVERFVRVACPARGTTLASGRLDRYLSVLNMGISALVQLEWVKDVVWFVAAVAKERTDPQVMPGLEAMMPGSATVRLLNRSGVTLNTDLRVIAGDYDGDGILGTVADWASEGFYGSENDVVVNTPSMYGGAERLGKNQVPRGWFFHAQGAQVYHFSYFKQPLTAGQLANGLLQEDARSAGFQPLSQAPHRDDPIARGVIFDYVREGWGDPLERKSPSADGSKPIVILVPGIMGTHLKVAGKRVWIEFGKIAEGEFSRLTEDASGVETDGVLKMTYLALGNYLSSSHEVLYYPYDWRLSLHGKGKEFADYMDQVLKGARTNKRPVRILAHSMGGLLVRMAAVLSGEKREGNGWWESFRAQTGNRLVMAGTPNGGSWTVPYVLTGRDSVIGMLTTVDLRHDKRDILKIASGFEGFLEMLPPDDADWCFQPETWLSWQGADGAAWPVPEAASLAKSRETRKDLDDFDFDREKDLVRYVAGCADETPSGVRVSDGRLVFDGSPLGDGRVLWATGIPTGIKTWYVGAKHGDLLNCEKAFKGLSEIVSIGETTLLPTAPPAQRGEGAKAGEMTEKMIPFYPDEAMLQRAALGGEMIPARDRGAETGARAFRVAVCHGDLAAGKYPVAVGHYVGDTISGTEAVLDCRLAGLMKRRHTLGIYPGPEGSSEIFTRELKKRSFTALVVGLGQVGDLTPALLTSGFTGALLKFATSPAARRGSPEQQNGFAISTILIGSGAGWGLGVRESVRALIEGAVRANTLLAELGGDPVYLAELEFLEVFEDRALQALLAVRELASLGALGNIDYDTVLRPGGGGRCRAMSEESPDWWQRIKVEVNDQDEMKFTTLTGLARVEETVLPTQRALVDRMVEQAVTQSTLSQDDMAAIYNLVSPLALKERAPDQGDILMLVDEKAARYPWEMMHIGVGDRKIALALRAGMVRQLTVKEFRQRPARAYQSLALVVAEPQLPEDSELPQLPGAREEGEGVAAALETHGYAVTRQVGSEAIKIVSALFARSYRILHLAGHGVYDYPLAPVQTPCGARPRTVTGMVLDWPRQAVEGAKEPVFLTAVEVKQMSVVPELVFINCCFLGRTDVNDPAAPASQDRNLFAASLATSFIGLGVRAVVAAGWAVNDRAAKAFASRFYETFLSGSSFGEAVSAARKAAHDEGPEYNTWAAYQCYGDPAYRLDGQQSQRRGKFFLAPREAVYELWAIRDRKRGDDGRQLDAAALLQELQQAERLISHEWMTRYGEIRSALGSAYAGLGQFDRALQHYQAATTCSDGVCTLKDLDQLANCRARAAEQRVRSGAISKEDGRSEINAVIEQLEARSAEWGEITERSAITASAYKLLLMLDPNSKKETDRILAGMATWYRKAAHLEGDIDPYPALNWIFVQLLETSRQPKQDSAEIERLRDDLNKAAQAGKLLNKRDPGFWHGVHEIDADLYRMLLDEMTGVAVKDLAVNLDRLCQRYFELADTFGTSRMMASVAKQVRFIASNLPKSLAEMKAALEEMAAKLAA